MPHLEKFDTKSAIEIIDLDANVINNDAKIRKFDPVLIAKLKEEQIEASGLEDPSTVMAAIKIDNDELDDELDDDLTDEEFDHMMTQLIEEVDDTTASNRKETWAEWVLTKVGDLPFYSRVIRAMVHAFVCALLIFADVKMTSGSIVGAVFAALATFFAVIISRFFDVAEYFLPKGPFSFGPESLWDKFLAQIKKFPPLRWLATGLRVIMYALSAYGKVTLMSSLYLWMAPVVSPTYLAAAGTAVATIGALQLSTTLAKAIKPIFSYMKTYFGGRETGMLFRVLMSNRRDKYSEASRYVGSIVAASLASLCGGKSLACRSVTTIFKIPGVVGALKDLQETFVAAYELVVDTASGKTPPFRLIFRKFNCLPPEWHFKGWDEAQPGFNPVRLIGGSVQRTFDATGLSSETGSNLALAQSADSAERDDVLRRDEWATHDYADGSLELLGSNLGGTAEKGKPLEDRSGVTNSITERWRRGDSKDYDPLRDYPDNTAKMRSSAPQEKHSKIVRLSSADKGWVVYRNNETITVCAQDDDPKSGLKFKYDTQDVYTLDGSLLRVQHFGIQKQANEILVTPKAKHDHANLSFFMLLPLPENIESTRLFVVKTDQPMNYVASKGGTGDLVGVAGGERKSTFTVHKYAITP